MKLASVFSLALLAQLMPSPSSAKTLVVDCTADQLEQIAQAVDKQGGILAACERDSGFALFPFAAYPTGEQQHIVCMGRSCPTALSNLKEAKLPECLVRLSGSNRKATPAEFLDTLCP